MTAKRAYRRWDNHDTVILVHLLGAGLTDRQAAEALGRTVRSLRARMRTLNLNRGRDRCAFCGTTLVQRTGWPGRKRLFCDRDCRRRYGCAYAINARRDARAAASDAGGAS